MLENNNECPICSTENTFREAVTKNGFYKIKCNRCGKFKLHSLAFSQIDITDKNIQALLSHWIRTHQGNIEIELTGELIENILKNNSLPKPKEQINNIILWLGKNLTHLSDWCELDIIPLTSIVGCHNKNDLNLLISHLKRDDIIKQPGIKEWDKKEKATLTIKGWERYDELMKVTKDSRLAFMAMQYDNKILQEIYTNVIIDAVKETGFEIRKLDDVKRAGLIDDKLRIEIRRSRFIISDLTDENRGAYWEAGFAEGLGIPVIYICEESKFDKLLTHFDTNHHLTVKWKNDKEGLKTFAEELKGTIRETLPSKAKMED